MSKFAYRNNDYFNEHRTYVFETNSGILFSKVHWYNGYWYTVNGLQYKAISVKAYEIHMVKRKEKDIFLAHQLEWDNDPDLQFQIMEKHARAYVSCIIFKDVRNMMTLYSLSVSKKYRKQGLATKLLERVKILALQHHCEYLTLYVKQGSWVEDWYRRLGFVDHTGSDLNEGQIWLKKKINVNES